MFVTELNCTGEEETVLDCPHNGIEGFSCDTNEDASVICNSELYL